MFFVDVCFCFFKKGSVCYKAKCYHISSNNTQSNTQHQNLSVLRSKWSCMYKCYSTYKSVCCWSAVVFIRPLFMRQESVGGRTHPPTHRPENTRRKHFSGYIHKPHTHLHTDICILLPATNKKKEIYFYLWHEQHWCTTVREHVFEKDHVN